MGAPARVGAGAEEEFQSFGAVANDFYATGDVAGKVPAQHMQGQLLVAGIVFHQQNLHGMVHGSGSMVK